MPQYFKTISVILAVIVLTFVAGGISLSQVKKAQAYTDGALIKAANDPNIYIINNNLKVWVRSIDVFNTCGYDWNNLNNVSSLDEVPTADLIKRADNPDVFRLQKNFKRKLASIEIFESYGLDWNKIAAVCPAVLDSYSRAPLVQLQDSFSIYRVGADFIRHHYPTWASFVNDGKQTRDVIEINALEFSSYAEGAAMGEIGGQGGEQDGDAGQTNLPAAPVLTDPGTATNSGNSFTLGWSAVSNVIIYVLEQDTDSSFTNPTTIYSGAGTSYSHSLTPAHTNTYYWRVQARNNIGHSPWSSTVDMQVTVSGCDLPAVPVLDTSAATVTAGNGYTLSWSAVSSATSYSLERATDDGFTDATVVYTGSGLNQTQNLSPGLTTNYRYRVRAHNSCGYSDWSSIKSVKVNAGPPGAPVLIDPGESIERDIQFEITWPSVNEATAYTLEISQSNDFAVVAATHNLGNVTAYNCTHAVVGVFYYRVKATNSFGDSAWSNVVDMKVVPEAPIISMSAASVYSDENYTVSWNVPLGAQYFGIEYGTNADFVGALGMSTMDTSTVSLTQSYGAITVTTYYYRVYAATMSGLQSAWSDIGIAQIKPQVPYQYPAIQAAIDAAASGQTVYVGAGTYTGSIIMKAGVNLYGAGADKTTLDGNDDWAAVTCANNTLIQGFKITNAKSNLIRCDNKTNVIIRNNLLVSRAATLGYTPSGIVIVNNTSVVIKNNTLYVTAGGASTGIFADTSAYSIEAMNNIVIGYVQGYFPQGSSGTAVSSYNNIVSPDPVRSWYGSVSQGVGDIAQDPSFVNTAAENFTLQQGSPCINTGNPNAVYNDKDGTRNNMGAFGGPYGI